MEKVHDLKKEKIVTGFTENYGKQATIIVS